MIFSYNFRDGFQQPLVFRASEPAVLAELPDFNSGITISAANEQPQPGPGGLILEVCAQIGLDIRSNLVKPT